MRWQDKIDSDEVRKTIALLKPDHQLFEIRILGADKRNVHSGYFTDVETLLEAFDSVDLRNANIYITLHELNEALYSRIQHDVFVRNTNTTSDTEVDRYQWFFIDLDPVRPANISSSEEELQANHSGIPHGGFVFRTGVTGFNGEHKHVIEYSLKLDSNPEFTSSVILAYARAVNRLHQEGANGCKTVFDVAPAYLSPLSGEELRAHML